MVLEWLLDPIFKPLLLVEPVLGVLIISVSISLLITIIYKKFTNQSLMKDLKDEIKELQKDMKKLRDKPEEMMKVNKKAMEANMKYMSHSMRPTLITFIPIIIIFGWLNSHMAYYPLVEGRDFTSTLIFQEGASGTVDISVPEDITIVKGGASQEIADGKATWVLKGKAGEYVVSYSYNGKSISQDVTLTKTKSDRSYATPELSKKTKPELKDAGIDKIVLSNEKIRPLSTIPVIKNIPWIGGFGWLGTYILFSIISSILIRKWLKVY